MRQILLALTLLVVSAASSAGQMAVEDHVSLPGGATLARTCRQSRAEGISIDVVDTRHVPANAVDYLDNLRKRVARRFWASAVDVPRMAAWGVMLLHDGSLTNAYPVSRADDRTFDDATAEALAIHASDPYLVRVPEEIPDSLSLLVTFGRANDGSPFVTSHVECPVIAMPDEPAPVVPRNATRPSGDALLRFVIDTAGQADSSTAVVLEATDEAYAAAALAIVPRLRYVPATFDSVRVRAQIEQRLTFVPARKPEQSP